MKKLKIYKRAFNDLWHIGKKYYVLYFIQTFTKSSMPFIGFIYMTRIVNALTENNLANIPALILQYLGILLVLQIIGGIVQPLVDNESSIFTQMLFSEPNKKMLSMHYHYAESSKVREQLAVINRNMLSGQSSLAIINMRLQYMLPGLISLVWGLILLIPLFTVDMSNLPTNFRWLNPWVIIGIFILIISGLVVYQLNTSKKSSQRLNTMFGKMQESNAKFHYEYDILDDVKSGKEIRLYNLTEKMIENAREDNEYTKELMAENYKKFNKTRLPSVGSFQIVNYLIYAYVGLLVLLGALPLALIIQLSNALSQMTSVIPDIIQQAMMTISAPEQLEEYYDFMDLPDEEMVGSLPVEKRLDNEYQLSVKDLSFAYPDSEEFVLKDITESFEVGKKYAIVGENGSGKTTFIKLLTRLYEPTEGSIEMNRIDSRKYDLREYFDLFGVVFQDYYLLGFSIGQNVSVEPSYDADVVLQNLADVDLGNFVKNLPNQLNTYLGTEFDENGVNVSGGQEQKIALARALYKDAPVMILDEPTAALDPLTEFEIYQKFDQIVEDKTAFYISHRLSSSKLCDEVLVFDEGEIVQRGPHEELVKEEGKYQDLWEAQAQYYQ